MSELDQLCINTIRFLAVDGVQKAKSGHPGLPMGAAPMAYALWTRHLRHNPANPAWANRDRFVLSGGHGSMLLYSLLHLTGYDLPLDELKRFRQWGSKTPGHPEYGLTPGVEATTGPLGQGFATAWAWRSPKPHLAGDLQPAGPRHRRPLHLRHRQRRRPDGRRRLRSRLAGRPPGPGQAHLPLRRQPDLDRGLHGPRLHRGPRQALRGLRLARPARWRRARHRGHRPGHRGRQARTRGRR